MVNQKLQHTTKETLCSRMICGIEIAAIDPIASMKAIDNPKLSEIAETIGQKLKTVIETVWLKTNCRIWNLSIADAIIFAKISFQYFGIKDKNRGDFEKYLFKLTMHIRQDSKKADPIKKEDARSGIHWLFFLSYLINTASFY